MKVTIRTKFNWAVFNTETKFRLTEYAIKSRAIYDMQCILRDQPELKGKIAIKQRNFEE
jgi:hypothetical protein